MRNKIKITQSKSSACTEMRDSTKSEEMKYRWLPIPQERKLWTFIFSFSMMLSNCWRMKPKITIKHFRMALEANVNQDHLFSWSRNLVCRQSACLVGPKQNYVNGEKMQTCNHPMRRIQQTNTTSWAGEDRTRLTSYSQCDYTCILFQACNCVWQFSVKTTDIKKIYFITRKLPYMKGENRNIRISIKK